MSVTSVKNTTQIGKLSCYFFLRRDLSCLQALCVSYWLSEFFSMPLSRNQYLSVNVVKNIDDIDLKSCHLLPNLPFVQVR